MKAYKSPLILHDFLLLNHEYQFIQPTTDNGNIKELIEDYNLDIDFVFNSMDNDMMQLFTKIKVNNIEEPLPGYVLFVEGVCIFKFDKSSKLNEKEKDNLLYVSGLNICINSLRNILATTTSNGPFGKYTLPAINVNKLFEDKQDLVSAKNKNNRD